MESETQYETKASRLPQLDSNVKKRKRMYEAEDSLQRYELLRALSICEVDLTQCQVVLLVLL